MADISYDAFRAEVQRLWAEILVLPEVGPDDNFFRLGGDSLAATNVMAAIEKWTGVALDPIEVFDAPTLTEFSAKLFAIVTAESGEEMDEGVL